MIQKLRTNPPTMRERLLHIDDLFLPDPRVLRQYLYQLMQQLPDDVVEFVFECTSWFTTDAKMSGIGYTMASIPFESGRAYFVNVLEDLTPLQAAHTLPLAIANAYTLAEWPRLQGPDVRPLSEQLVASWGLNQAKLSKSFGMENR